MSNRSAISKISLSDSRQRAIQKEYISGNLGTYAHKQAILHVLGVPDLQGLDTYLIQGATA